MNEEPTHMRLDSGRRNDDDENTVTTTVTTCDTDNDAQTDERRAPPTSIYDKIRFHDYTIELESLRAVTLD